MVARNVLRPFRQSEIRKPREPESCVGRTMSLAAELAVTVHDGFGVAFNPVPDRLAETATAMHGVLPKWRNRIHQPKNYNCHARASGHPFLRLVPGETWMSAF